jgi:hypothetical protein
MALSWFTCVRETAKIIDRPKKGPGGWKSGIGTQKAQNGEVLKGKPEGEGNMQARLVSKACDAIRSLLQGICACRL